MAPVRTAEGRMWLYWPETQMETPGVHLLIRRGCFLGPVTEVRALVYLIISSQPYLLFQQ